MILLDRDDLVGGRTREGPEEEGSMAMAMTMADVVDAAGARPRVLDRPAARPTDIGSMPAASADSTRDNMMGMEMTIVARRRPTKEAALHRLDREHVPDYFLSEEREEIS
jgi:hypothetical protein